MNAAPQMQPEDPLLAGMKFVKVPKGTFWMSKDGVNAQVQKTIGAAAPT